MLLRFISVSILSIALSGCSSLEFPWVYRISVQQGNIIDQEEVDKLEIGMTKRQVQFVMGSPLLIDTFNQNRWDYYYSRRDGDGNTAKKQFTVFFEDDKYVRHEGDVEPSADKPDDSTDTSESAGSEAPTDASDISKSGDNTTF
ncbi:MAG TPA: outer membrane protein assembly factor BamE [Marinagarivorans sp.]